MNRKTKTAVKIIIAVMGFLFIGHLYMWNKFKTEVALFSSFRTTDKTPVHVVIGEREYCIPKNYFDSPYTEWDRKEQTLGIRAYYPDMHGATKETIEFEKKNFGHGDKVRISLYLRPHKNYDALYKNYKRNIENKTPYNYRYQEKRYNLHYFQAMPIKLRSHDKDIFVDDLEKPSTLIRCDAELSKNPYLKSPGCRQTFYRGMVEYYIAYSRDHQPEWKLIQQKAEVLLNQFAISP